MSRTRNHRSYWVLYLCLGIAFLGWSLYQSNQFFHERVAYGNAGNPNGASNPESTVLAHPTPQDLLDAKLVAAGFRPDPHCYASRVKQNVLMKDLCRIFDCTPEDFSCPPNRARSNLRLGKLHFTEYPIDRVLARDEFVLQLWFAEQDPAKRAKDFQEDIVHVAVFLNWQTAK